jgi:hypothetical protein
MVRKCGGCLIAAVLLLHAPTFAVAGNTFEDRCTDLSKEAKIAVLFAGRQVTRNDSRSLSELKGLSGSRSNQYHSILGLTHAAPSAKLDLTPNMLTVENGRTCVVPSLALTLGFSEFEVYLAKELKDSCRRRIVEEHENEHVGVWRNHFRAGARLLETTLRNALAKPTYSNSQDEAVNEMRHHVDEVISALLQKLKDGAIAANQQLDSPASYQFEENRMRACP